MFNRQRRKNSTPSHTFKQQRSALTTQRNTAHLPKRYTAPPNLRAYRVHAPVRAFIWRWKWVAFILIIATATQTIISVIADKGIGNRAVLVARSEIAVGETFTASNTTTQLYPENNVPENALTDLAQISEKTASATISRGLPITKNQVLDDNYLANAPAGMVIASITLRDDISAQLLQPGNHIELYAPAAEKGAPARLLTTNAVVIGKPTGKIKAPLFSDAPETTVRYIAVKKADANIILGLQSNTPLQAVILQN